jgi:hypothetical protein
LSFYALCSNTNAKNSREQDENRLTVPTETIPTPPIIRTTNSEIMSGDDTAGECVFLLQFRLFICVLNFCRCADSSEPQQSVTKTRFGRLSKKRDSNTPTPVCFVVSARFMLLLGDLS